MNSYDSDNAGIQEPLVDCPACGLPSEITDRFILDGAPGPVEHVKIVCVKGHWFTPPADQLLIAEPDLLRARGRAAVIPSGRTPGADPAPGGIEPGNRG